LARPALSGGAAWRSFLDKQSSPPSAVVWCAAPCCAVPCCAGLAAHMRLCYGLLDTAGYSTNAKDSMSCIAAKRYVYHKQTIDFKIHGLPSCDATPCTAHCCGQQQQQPAPTWYAVMAATSSSSTMSHCMRSARPTSAGFEACSRAAAQLAVSPPPHCSAHKLQSMVLLSQGAPQGLRAAQFKSRQTAATGVVRLCLCLLLFVHKLCTAAALQRAP
jgi:hypothetical protein